jgi:hypothetical protein
VLLTGTVQPTVPIILTSHFVQATLLKKRPADHIMSSIWGFYCPLYDENRILYLCKKRCNTLLHCPLMGLLPSKLFYITSSEPTAVYMFQTQTYMCMPSVSTNKGKTNLEGGRWRSILYKGESVNRSQMDIKRETCDIRTWRKHLFRDITSTDTDTLVPSLYSSKPAA